MKDERPSLSRCYIVSSSLQLSWRSKRSKFQRNAQLVDKSHHRDEDFSRESDNSQYRAKVARIERALNDLANDPKKYEHRSKGEALVGMHKKDVRSEDVETLSSNEEGWKAFYNRFEKERDLSFVERNKTEILLLDYPRGTGTTLKRRINGQ